MRLFFRFAALAVAVGLFTTYLYPFELTSILLLVAAIGAIYLSRKKIDDL